VDPQDYLFLLPLWYVVFLLSVTAHEAGHAFVAQIGGDETAYLAGQVSLNPMPHIRREPFGTVIVPLLTFLMNGWMMGWASAPYDPSWEDRHPQRAALMALAGPGANLVLASIAFVLLRVGLTAGWWVPAFEGGVAQLVTPLAADAGGIEALGRLLSILLGLNVLLLVFNLIPVPPLDGASVLAGFVPAVRPLRDHIRSSGIGALAGIVVAWLLIRPIFPWVYYPILRLLFSSPG
jgi:Zn-dependent protease